MPVSLRKKASKYFQYDTDAGAIRTSLQLKSTVIWPVIKKPAFGLFFCLHVCIKLSFWKGWLVEAADPTSKLYIGWHEMGVVTAMTTFFEVFYTNQCFNRYMQLHKDTRQMFGMSFDFVCDLRLACDRVAKQHVRLASRYLAASVMLLFYEIAAGPGGEIKESNWLELLRIGLLKENERQFLENSEAHDKVFLLLHWAGDVACKGHAIATAKEKMPANVRKGLLDRLYDIRLEGQQVRDIQNFPTPYAYFHLLNVMIVVNLALWAYGMGTCSSAWSTPVFCFSALIFMGLLELGSWLSNPFGDDEVDFPLGVWTHEWLHEMFTFVEYDFPGRQDEWENALEHETPIRTEIFHGGLFGGCGFLEQDEQPQDSVRDEESREARCCLLHRGQAL